MPLETGTFINSLVATNPAATDALSVADDHLRLIKSTILNTFPGITGAINATQAELNVMDGGTAATSTTLVDADRMVMNDDGTMKQVSLSDLITYLTANLAITSAMITDGTIATADIADGQITQAKLASSVTLIPSGVILPFAGDVAPTDYLLCYGQTLNRSQYADLYAAIGETYGAGDGSTTFVLPDLRGRVIAGQDDMGGNSANRLTNQTGGLDGDALGATGGAETHTLSTAQIPNHSHFMVNNRNVANRSDSDPSTTNYLDRGAQQNPEGDEKYLLRFHSTVADRGLTSSTGGDGAHNNVQPTMILNYIIKI